MKLKSKKSALLLSFTSLLLCFAMLAGSTFAWFTDTATTGVNKIVAGNLDVELLMYKEVNGRYDYVNISKEPAPIFGSENSTVAQDNNLDTLWEPGKTQVAYLAIKNEGNLDLKYQVALNVTNPADGKDLYQVMQYAIAPNAKGTDLVLPEWTTGSSVIPGAQIVSGTNTTDANPAGVKLLHGETHYFALLVHMDKNAGNKYQNGKVKFDLTVYATQLNHENDSFGPDYDKNAPFPIPVTANVADAEGIRAAIQQGETAGVPVKITLTGDVSGADLNGGDVTVNVADKTLTLLYNTPISQGQVTIIGNEGAKLGNTKNVTVTGEGKLTMGIGIGDANAYQATSFKVTDGGTLNITGGTNEHSGSEGKLITATDGGSTVNISGGNFKPSGSKFKLVEAQNGAVVNVTGGTFSCSGEKSVVFYANGGTINISDCKVLSVNGNIFQIENGGQIVVTGGTFAQDPSAHVPQDHTVTKNGNIWTVR